MNDEARIDEFLPGWCSKWICGWGGLNMNVYKMSHIRLTLMNKVCDHKIVVWGANSAPII